LKGRRRRKAAEKQKRKWIRPAPEGEKNEKTSGKRKYMLTSSRYHDIFEKLATAFFLIQKIGRR